MRCGTSLTCTGRVALPVLHTAVIFSHNRGRAGLLPAAGPNFCACWQQQTMSRSAQKCIWDSDQDKAAQIMTRPHTQGQS